MRLLVKLRVQNPNDAPVNYNGVSVEMNVQGKSFATGVSDAHGSVPRFGDAVISVPVTVSAFRMMGQALGMMRNGAMDKLTYEMKGKLHRSSLRAARISRHEVNWSFRRQPARANESLLTEASAPWQHLIRPPSATRS